MGLLGKITGADSAARAAKRGAKRSRDAIIKSSDEQIDFSKWLWGEQTELMQPYADLATDAIPQYKDEVEKGMTLDDVYNDPGYQFGMNEGIRARDNSASSKGMSLSGAAAKAMTRFGNDYGSTKYGEAFERRQSRLDNLYRMISTGHTATTNQMNAGSTMGTQVINAMRDKGGANAGYHTDIGNINASKATSGFNTLMDLGSLAVSAYGASNLGKK